jgi:hypothetical protein
MGFTTGSRGEVPRGERKKKKTVIRETIIILINYKEKRPFRKLILAQLALKFSVFYATQRCQKSLSLNPIQSQMNPVHTLFPHLNIILPEI